jgi:hypothetical protein
MGAVAVGMTMVQVLLLDVIVLLQVEVVVRLVQEVRVIRQQYPQCKAIREEPALLLQV